MLWLCSRTFDSDYFVGNDKKDNDSINDDNIKDDNNDDEVKEDNKDDADQGVVAPPARTGQPPLLAPPAAPDQQGAGHEDHFQERSLSSLGAGQNYMIMIISMNK